MFSSSLLLERKRRLIRFSLYALGTVSISSCATHTRERAELSELPPQIRQVGECLSSILKSNPNVRDVRLAGRRNRIRAFVVIGYDAVDQKGNLRTVEFAVWDPDNKGKEAVYDEAYALGFDVDDNAFLIDNIEITWKAKCNASGFIQTGPVLSPDK